MTRKTKRKIGPRGKYKQGLAYAVQKDMNEITTDRVIDTLPDKTVVGIRKDIDEVIKARRAKTIRKLLPDRTAVGAFKDVMDLTKKRNLEMLPDKTLIALSKKLSRAIKRKHSEIKKMASKKPRKRRKPIV